MRRVATFVGGLTLMGSLVGCLFYSTENFLPAPYKIEQKRGAEVIYNQNGEVFVHSNPKNMLTYLLREDPARLRRVLSKLEVQNGD